jgi:hypothetical protein
MLRYVALLSVTLLIITMLDRSLWVGGVLTVLVAAGCQTQRAPLVEDTESLEACAPELQDSIALRVSAAPRNVPAELRVNETPDKRYALVAHRFLVSIVPKAPALGTRILDSTLTITPYGGTFVEWGRLDGSTAALDVVPGRFRVTPFLMSGALRAQTHELDMVVQAGGAPVDQAAITTGDLWDAAHRPLSPDAVRISLVPIRHFTAYDIVEAKAAVEFIAQRSRSEPARKCAIETRMTLVDEDAARPPLWDLATARPGGTRKLWLALFDSKAGPVRTIFTDPIAARGFAEWIRQTDATRVSRYQLGVFEPESLEDEPRVVPTDRAIMDSFRPASPEELTSLTVGMLAVP